MAQTAKTVDRGYGRAHRQLRARLKPVVDAGQAVCWRCGGQILPGEPWHLGHDDFDRSVYRGPEHRGCNESAAGRAAHLTFREW